jgi:integrase
MPRIRKRQQQPYQTGEKGVNRVRVYLHKSGRLFLEYRRAGRKVRQSLGHADWTRAKMEAEDVAGQLRRPDHRDAVSLAVLFDNYLREVTPTKSARKQQHDRRTVGLMLRIFGSGRRAAELTHRDAARYASERRRIGDLRPRKGDAPAPPVGPRMIAYDLHFLRAVLHWGVGAGWLDRNPLAGFRIAEEPNPRRPVFTEGHYQALLGVAGTFPPAFRLLLVLAHETGHRIGALLALRWSDLDLTTERIRWRAASDKIGWEHSTPLTTEARGALETFRALHPGIGESAVFPGSRHLCRDWMERAQKRAGLPPEKGRGWHAIRRHFASELRHVPLRDLCDLGGWKDSTTVVKCYQRPSEEAQVAALESRRILLA